jgi:hypothetical protein
MERVGDEVARELGRFGPVSGMAPLVEAWPQAVGPEIARNAWPARIGRDGTLHVHTRDSVWAFELTSRAEEVRARLGELAPPRIAFAPGPLPERSPEPSADRPADPPRPSAQHVAEADSLSRVIRDEDLRKVVAKTIAGSLARADSDRMFW